MMEAMLPEYGRLGKIKQPTGGGIATAAPTNAYPTRDGDWILIAANSEPLFRKLATVMGRPELADDARFIGNAARVAHVGALDEMISAWTRGQDTATLALLLEAADIPASKVYTAADITEDPQYRFRGMVQEIEDPGLGPVLHAGVVPHVPQGAGTIRWTGPDIGQHGAEILSELLHYDADRIAELRHQGAMA